MIQPDIALTHGDRAHLTAITSMAGYHILHRIMRAEVDKFVIALLNADVSNDSEIVARHKLAKAAAQFYQAVTDRTNEEVTLYTNAPRRSDAPRDVTAGVIDFGDVASERDLPGGDEF